MTKRILKIILGVALIPFCAGFTWQIVAVLFTSAYKPLLPYYFITGVLLYLVVHLLFRKPLFSYVLAHELTHALFAVLSGGSIKSLHASVRGGKVVVSKSNFLITLAPYFFPLYACIALLLYGAAVATHAGAVATNALAVLSGSAFTFHLALTLIFLHEDQSDIREQGVFFSYPLIYLFNIGFAALLVEIFIAKDMNYPAFCASGIMTSTGMLVTLVKKAIDFMP
jgi:hypothetical protein